MSNRVFHLRTLILAVLVPVIILITLVVGMTIYQNLGEVFVVGFDKKLKATSTVTGAFIDADDHANILAEKNMQSAKYLSYVNPMIAIKDKLDITYLYTQQIYSDSSVVYVLDATDSPIGDIDTPPLADFLGAQDVMLHGTIYYSDVRLWERWGLLKVAFAPIFNARSDVVAMAGADINVSVINHKKRIAFFKIALAGIFVLLLAGLISFAVSSRLIEPINQIKRAALQVAAGHYEKRVDIRTPQELALLSESFNRVVSNLHQNVSQQQKDNKDLEDKRRQNALLNALSGGVFVDHSGPSANLFAIWQHRKPVCANASGWLVFDHCALLWFAPASADLFGAIQMRSDIRVTGQMLRFGAGGEDVVKSLNNLYPDIGFVWCDLNAATLCVQTQRPIFIYTIGQDSVEVTGYFNQTVSGMQTVGIVGQKVDGSFLQNPDHNFGPSANGLHGVLRTSGGNDGTSENDRST